MSTTTEKIRWGVISTAKIGLEKVIPAMQNASFCDIQAIASRDQPRADAAASALNIPKAYGSYEALLADSEIDAIYNPLPNHLHVPVSIQALEHGKHVIEVSWPKRSRTLTDSCAIGCVSVFDRLLDESHQLLSLYMINL